MKIKSVTLLSRFLVTLTLFAFPCARLEAQISNVPARITQAVDETNLVTLKGNVHPLARAEFDQGAVSDGQPLHRMLLLLQRSADQEADLQKLLDDQQNKSAANYHAWLTPAQFGQQFGPADTDIQTVTGWLQSHGFQITNVTQGRTLIEFSGNAAQVRNAFHTEMHKYLVNGATHLANASDPQIPAAFAPVVAGPVSLNNFPISSHIRKLGSFHRAKGSSLAQPLYTFSGGCTPAGCFALGPADFATIYNSAPLLTGSPKIDGTGQTIAIVGESDIDPTDVTDFQTMFGMTPSFSAAANIIVNGADPGVNDSEGESDLDVQWAGAVAPGATVKFVTSEPTETTAGIVLSAIFIVENNFAGVLSESFGACEQQIGTLNQFHNALWEQAAAQGITVMVSAGDGGSAGCDNFDTAQTATQGLAVSGFASTPFNVAVGGTDFDEINKWSQYWSATNNSMNQSSALSYIPEIPWNENCAQLGIDGCGSSAPNGSLNIVAGSGGVSTLYAKPSWQSGTGVPNDGHRDLPDVSLFASPGFDGTFYIVCQKDVTDAPSCNLSDLTFQGVGGTSASAPAFAGIMALVNQSQATARNPAPRQGNANYVLYSLFKKQTNTSPALNCSSSAASKSCTFYDITHGNSGLPDSTGTNSVPCAGGSPNCSVSVAGSSDGVLVTAATPPVEAYTVDTGYDLATGLGSVNVANLVKNWASVTFLPSTTTLSATVNGNSVTSISGITHGTPVNVTSTVAAGQGATGTPSGQVALLATPNPIHGALGASLGFDVLSLASGTAAGTNVILPGGQYNLTAHYQGDGTFGSSESTPGISVTISAEPSKTLISIPTFNATTGLETGNTPSSLVYGSLYLARIDVGNAQAKLSYPPQQICTPPACPTGTITWTDAVNGNPAARLDGGTFALNSAGFTEDQLINLPGGTHVLSATYSGDESFAASTTPTTYNLTVTPAPTSATLQTVGGTTFVVGTPSGVTVNGSAQAIAGIAPTGTITFLDGSTPLGGPVTVTGTASQTGTLPMFSASASVTVTTAGQHSISAQYSGDANYAPLTVPAVTVTVLNPPPTLTSLSPTTANSGSPSFTLTITGSGFLNGATAYFLNSTGLPTPLTTTFVSSTQLTAVVPASAFALPWACTVNVGNPSPTVGASNSLNFTVNLGTYPVPTLNSILPTTIVAGSFPFPLYATGTNFAPGAVLNFNGTPQTTTPGSPQGTFAVISTAQISTPGTVQVTVTNPPPGGGTSAAQPFVITQPTVVPTITSVSPATIYAGFPTNLTINGTGFTQGATMSLGGFGGSNYYPVSFISSTQLSVPNFDSNAVGSASMYVIDPAPAGTSPAFSLTVTQPPAPTITSITPTSAPTGAQVTLTINGSNFQPVPIILFNNQNNFTYNTNYNGTTQLTTSLILGSLPAGTYPITVVNVTPATVSSNSVNFTVTGAPDFSFTVAPGQGTQTVTAGQTATFTNVISVNAVNGFTGQVAVSCTSPAQATTCSLNQNTLAAGQSATVMVTTTARSLAPPLPSNRRIISWPRLVPVIVVILLCFLLARLARTRRQRVMAALPLAGLLLLLVLQAIGCGGGSSYTPPPPPPSGTPAGTYTITVTGVSTNPNATHTATLQLIVN
jgi:Pro-kumamolisin, activation domain/Bacterial Ig-like domain (group 3)/IPT/TIG domain